MNMAKDRVLLSPIPVNRARLVYDRETPVMTETAEAVAVEDLAALGRIYARIARDVLAGQA